MSAKKQLKFTANALRNIVEAEEYIARDKPKAAADIVKAIYEAASSLKQFPEVGRAGKVSGTRELVVKSSPYIIVYRIRAERVVISAVLHHSRNYP